MASPKWSEWRLVGSEGEIPEELLPAGQLQYLWRLTYIWPPDDTWGVSGRLFRMTGDLRIEADGEAVFTTEDRIVFVCTCFMFGSIVDLWTYYAGTLEMLAHGGELVDPPPPSFGQPDWQYDPEFGSAGFGID